ncbi:hypothetical protein AMECASPLE_029469 [Ameca splendens]|uniref:Uncharacterized protein n=1 Tax=Ameca splendens TaxID=208324 RepID=A0ABV0Y5Q7_9TELE
MVVFQSSLSWILTTRSTGEIELSEKIGVMVRVRYIPGSSTCCLMSEGVSDPPAGGTLSRYTWCLAFAATLQQLNEMAAQREDLADNLHTQIVCELMRYTQELKAERKTHFQDGRRAQQHIESSWKQLESVYSVIESSL